MKKPIRTAIAFCSVSALLLSACGSNKEAVTSDEFTSVMEENELSVTDQTESGDNEAYETILVATDPDQEKYSFEYYDMDSSDSASRIYDYLVENIEEYYEDASGTAYTETNIGTTQEYRITASDYYLVVSQRDDVVLYVTAYVESKDDAKQILEDLGY